MKNLTPGAAYQFDYVLGDDFFERVDGSEIRQGNINVSLSVVHISSAFELDFHIDGVVTMTCDRCLDDMEVPVVTENRLLVTFGETYAEISDEHIVVSEDEGFINVAWYMYEFIALAVPVKRVHETGGCNEMMVLKLKELCVDEIAEDEDFFREADELGEMNGSDDDDADPVSGKSNKPIDPRWEALRNLIGNN
ncbi:MAG: DUF177 domain-containing protein [Tannerella sp.]|nr:DUF177 domain-containing protein [Tannerella sp.]